MANADFTSPNTITATKTCTKCAEAKPLSEYYARKRKQPLVRNIKTDNMVAMCKACYVARAKQWAENNPDKRKAIARKWDSENAEARKEASRAYNSRPDTIERYKNWRIANSVSYQRNRRQSDPMYALKIRMRGLIRKAFDRNGYTKRSKTNDILGCDWETFVAHIERQFQKGMSWENRGEWHLDHIQPLADAACEADLIALNHYTNLRPLWGVENQRKSAIRTHLI